jgi:nicotinamidase-related amidase
MKTEKSAPVHVVVDLLYDFIDGTLACQNSETAVKESVNFINKNRGMAVAYICDNHPSNHSSFKEFGGIWPPHCVQGTRGGSIHDSFYKEVADPSARPGNSNTFYKGEDKDTEQYSGYEAISPESGTLDNYINTITSGVKSAEVYVSGVATEFCINATVRDLADSGRRVYLISDALAYVDRAGHEKTLKELSQYKNVTII